MCVRQIFRGTEEPWHHHGQPSQYILTDARGNTVRGSVPILELKVPMCCNKCEEKVKEHLKELEGVHDVVCDQTKQRVTVAGPVDPFLALRKAKKVKKKSDFFPTPPLVSVHSAPATMTTDKIHRYVHGSGTVDYYDPGAGLTRSNSFGRHLGRLPSFGKVVHYEDPAVYPVDQQHMRYYNHSRDHHDPYWEYSHRDYYGVMRRMPSFDRYRYHDAEFISMDDYEPPTPSYWEPQYVTHHYQRPPVYRSQVSFSKLPVTNPYYLKQIPSEY